MLCEMLLLARFLQWSFRESLSPELYLHKSFLIGPLNRTGKAGSCLTWNNFIELWSINFSHINTPDGCDTPITEIHCNSGLRGLEVSLGTIYWNWVQLHAWMRPTRTLPMKAIAMATMKNWLGCKVSFTTDSLDELHNSFKRTCN